MQDRWLVSLLLVVILLAGCVTTPQTPEAARDVAVAFLQARAGRNAAAAYSLLTPYARKAMDNSTVVDHLTHEAVQFTSVGVPIPRETGWVQVPIQNLTTRTEEFQVRWPEAHLTLRYDGRRWLVAWVDPLLSQAMLAYERSSFVEQLTLGRTIAEIDPYHYRGYLEQHFAYRGLKRYQDAEERLARAWESATPPQRVDVQDATARFKLSLGQTDEAIKSALAALEQAAPFIPATYSKRWEADTLVVLGRAFLAKGDRKAAEDVVRQALATDPHNGPLAIFRHNLTSSPNP